MTESSIKNFVKFGGYATAGQPNEIQLQQLADAGYRVVINLGMPDHPHAIVNEDQLLAEAGISYVHIPVDFKVPTPEQVRLFCQLLATIPADSIFIHCIMNFRVSAFLYHFLTKVHNVPAEQARSPMFDHWQPDECWQAMLNWTTEEIGL